MKRSIERQYTLQELAESAGVSIRTIRYYIGEGLLPVPAGAGPQSHYTESHAQRLQVIALLKDRYLPLKEIRRTLAGLDDAEIARLIDELGGSTAIEEQTTVHEMSADLPDMAEPSATYDAVDYIDRALGTRMQRQSGRSRSMAKRTAVSNEVEQWRRIEVADGVELLVREDRFRRKRDQIDWLTDWARKVID